jgi:hypothetical protein
VLLRERDISKGGERETNDKAFIYTEDIQIFLNKKAPQKYNTLKCKYNESHTAAQ